MYVLGVLIAREFADKKVWEHIQKYPIQPNDPAHPQPCQRNITDYFSTIDEADFIIKSLDADKESLLARYNNAH